jgi:transcriptional regulator with XRE-family HTH domain
VLAFLPIIDLSIGCRAIIRQERVIMATQTKISVAFDMTLEHFKISNIELAQRSGVDKTSLSRFRSGQRGVSLEALEKLIDSFSEDERLYFYFNCLVPSLSAEGRAILLQSIAQSMRDEAIKNSQFNDLQAVA